MQISGLDLSQNTQIKHLRREKKKTVPVSVERAIDIKRIGASFVVSSRAEAIHKAAVGKRCLHKERQSQYLPIKITGYRHVTFFFTRT